MSRNEWERGTITIPGSEWAKFKTAIRDAYNRRQIETLQLALRIYGELIAAGKGKRGFNYQEAFRGFDQANLVPTMRRLDWEATDIGAIDIALFGTGVKRRTVPLQPKKKDFPEANGATRRIAVGTEGSISFDEKARQVYWHVPENNHAVTRAHEHPIGRAFFAALSRVQWGTRGSAGGVILYGSEYDRESAESYEGGGGSRASARYGPAGERQDPVQAFLRARRRSSTRTAARKSAAH